jgi:hypothetical protein
MLAVNSLMTYNNIQAVLVCHAWLAQSLLAAINKSSRVEVMRQYISEHGSAEQFDSFALWSSFYDLR